MQPFAYYNFILYNNSVIKIFKKYRTEPAYVDLLKLF